MNTIDDLAGRLTLREEKKMGNPFLFLSFYYRLAVKKPQHNENIFPSLSPNPLQVTRALQPRRQRSLSPQISGSFIFPRHFLAD